MVVRLPRIDWAVGGVEKDFRWLPVLAPQLPVETPVPLAIGAPAEGYEWTWGVYRWLNSKAATLMAWPLARVADPMAGFFALPRELFESAAPLDPKTARDRVIRRATMEPWPTPRPASRLELPPSRSRRPSRSTPVPRR